MMSGFAVAIVAALFDQFVCQSGAQMTNPFQAAPWNLVNFNGQSATEQWRVLPFAWQPQQQHQPCSCMCPFALPIAVPVPVPVPVGAPNQQSTQAATNQFQIASNVAQSDLIKDPNFHKASPNLNAEILALAALASALGLNHPKSVGFTMASPLGAIEFGQNKAREAQVPRPEPGKAKSSE